MALMVELVLNGQEGDTLIALEKDGDHLWIDAATLRDAGIAIEGEGRVDVAARPDFTVTYDAGGQRLLLDVPPSMLPTRRIAAQRNRRVRTAVDTGFVLNYDLYVQRAGGRTSGSLLTEQRAFGAFGSVSNTGVVRAGGIGPDGYVRYDTRYRRIDEDRALALTAGDLISRSLQWTTAVRIGGVQLSRNFRVRPDLITAPLPSFAGQAAVPSGVDLFINGYRQQRTDVTPGRFVLDSVPVVNGAGEARIVTTDAVGRQVETVIPFYVSPDLLRRGLSDFSVEAGWLRRRYGLSSFAYGRAVASASGRYGLTDKTTLEGHVELAPGLAGLGGGALWSPGLWGSVHGAVAFSDRNGRRGGQIAAGYSYTGPSFGFGIEHVERSRGYADLGDFDLGRLRGGTQSDRASGTVVIPRLGNIGLAYIDSRARDNARFRLASASLSMPIGGRASLFGAMDYDMDRRSVSAQLRVSIPLGGQSVIGAGVTRQPGRDPGYQVGYSRAVPIEGGIGVATDAAIDGDGRFVGQATATWRAQSHQVDIGASTTPGDSAVWGGVSGSIAFLDGRVNAANALPDSFAIVSTGMAGVPVYYENQLIGRTGKGGRLFVPRVVAYHPGRFAIDTLDLPIEARADMVETQAALRENAGAVIRLPVRSARSLTARITGKGGAVLSPGTRAVLSDGRVLVVGWDGILFLDDRGTADRATFTGADGSCAASLPPVTGEPGEIVVIPCG